MDNKEKMLYAADREGLQNPEGEMTRGELCFLVFTAIFCVLKALGFYEGQQIFTAGMVAAFVFLLLKLLHTRMSVLEWVTVVLLLAMGGLVYLNTGEKSLLVNFAFLAGMKGVSQRRIFRTGAVCWGGGYILLTFLTLTGVHSDTIFMHNKHGIGYVICHSLGYAHSNVLHVNYLCVCAMILYLVKDELSKKQKAMLTAVLCLLDLYVFFYSVSFTGLIASILFYVIYLYVTFRGHLSKAEGVLAELVLPICVLFSLVGPLVIRGHLFDVINNALNTRYNLTRWFLTNQPITLFGTRMDLPNYRYTLDCSYAYLFMRLGVVPFAVLMALYVGTIHRLVKEQRLTELSIMLGLCIAGVTEPFLFNLAFKNVTLIFVGEFLFDVLRELGTHRRTAVSSETVESSARGSSYAPVRRETGWSVLRDDPAVSGRWLVADHILDGVREIVREWRSNRYPYLLAFILTAVLFSVGYTAVIPRPQMVFINSSVNEEKEKNRESFRLTEENVAELRKEGNIIIDYPGPDEPMYPYVGSTASIEYDRRTVSWGLWTAGAVCVAASGIVILRKHLKDMEENELSRN